MVDTITAIKNATNNLYYCCNISTKIVQAIIKAGGRPVLVGGAVRDAFLDSPAKDFDIEVYNLTVDALHQILSQFGQVNIIGKSFGVLKLYTIPIDWSLPRTDSTGRMPTVSIDPFMDFKNAFARRDLTINAMGIDFATKELIDPFNGKTDLKNNTLRAPVIEKFVEDPLRLFRVMQFVGRFNMQPDMVLHNACKTMSIKGVSIERIEQEYIKLFLYAPQPSKGFLWLHSIGRLQEFLPELYVTIDTLQDKRWHPEGNVFTHSMQALDAAAIIANKYAYDEEQKLILSCAALCHDLGKVSTTFEDEKGIHSYGHAETGAPLAINMLNRIFKNQQKLKKAVYKLVYYHMMPGALVRSNARLSRYQTLAAKLAPEVTMQQLSCLALADRQGRNAHSSTPLAKNDIDIELFLENTKQANVLTKRVEPLLDGTDLIELTSTNKEIGSLLRKAYEIQLNENITDKNTLKMALQKKCF